MNRLATLLCLVLLLGSALLGTPSAHAQQSRQQIRLNQIGYYPDAPKVAIIAGLSAGTTQFFIATPDLADTVFTGTLGVARTWSPSGESVRKADFTAFQAPGTYVVGIPGVGASYPFEIAPYVHQDVATAVIKAFYYQRASTRLYPQHADIWARLAGHLDNVVYIHPSAASPERPAGSTISAPRGWYDAGDYNKYIVNSGITTGTLLMLYEHYPAYFAELELNIPESGNGVPDLLDEVLWNLRWMLAMQDPNDGGVYTKLTDPNFDAMQLPHLANQRRYVIQKSTPAALDFAAVTALAARIYDDFETELPGLADSCRTAAQAAWDWAVENPDMPYNQTQVNSQFDPDINTGGYGDGNFTDEFRWAAAELFITTGNSVYVQMYNPTLENAGIPGWPNVGTLGLISVAHHRATVAPVLDTTSVKQKLTTLANSLVNLKRDSAFDMPFGQTNDFYWGSNSGTANQGMMLLQVYRMTNDRRYLDAALANLDYLVGRNGLGYSWVTGHGDKTAMHPHHRPSEGDRVAAPVPGLLIGGPNPQAPNQGETCPSYLGRLPATTYTDDVCSYATNEIAINWQAPMAYLAAAIEASFSPTGLPTAIEGPAEQPAPAQRLGLSSFPNPVRTSGTVTFHLPKATVVTVAVYDVLGRLVATPVSGMSLPAGPHAVALDVASLSSGAYVLQIHAGDDTATRTIVVVR